MPVNKEKGLEGLKGLSGLSEAQRKDFINKNRDLISAHHYDPVYTARLYANKQFIDAFGIKQFKATPNAKVRDQFFEEYTINNAALKYAPFDAKGKRNNNIGFGEYWEKFNELSNDGKLKVMQSNWLAPGEFERQWEKGYQDWNDTKRGKHGFWSQIGATGGGSSSLGSMMIEEAQYGETRKQGAREENQKIFDNIYNDDIDNTARQQAPLVSKCYQELLGLTDEQVKKNFIKAIMPGSFTYKNGMPNLGIGPYAAYYGNGKQGQVRNEMADFSIDDMRQVLAKKKAYEATMTPSMAKAALENDAKRYITEHQSSWQKRGKLAKDIGISAMSYTADKLNSVGEIKRLMEDAMFSEKPRVFVDDENNIIDPTKVKLTQGAKGVMYYTGKDGQKHSVHKEQVSRTTLHHLGKEADGSDIKGAWSTDWLTLNPQYWSRAEQFGTLDEAEQRQYEKIGYSPYKVMYNPNDDSDLWYETFKMASFGLADGLMQIVPFGIGAGFGALEKASKVGGFMQKANHLLSQTAKLFTAETKFGQVINGLGGAGGIAYAYGRGAFPETLMQNNEAMETRITTKLRNDLYDRYHNDKGYKAQIDKKIAAVAEVFKKDYLAQIKKGEAERPVDIKTLDNVIRSKAQDYVMAEELQHSTAAFKETQEYADMQERAMQGASDAALNTFLTEAAKYSLVNTLGHRKFMYQNPAGVNRRISSALKGLKEVTTKEGKKRLVADAGKFLTTADKWKQLGKSFGSQVWGGAWTNGTDDMQVDAAERINSDSFNRYLDAWENGDAMASTYGFADGLYSYLKGLQNSMGQETTASAALVGAMGSAFNVSPNFTNIVSLFTKQGRQFYKDSFRRSIERDADGNPLRNEDGSIKYKEYSKWHSPLGQLNFFLQNGVLSDYYGKKQAEKDLQNHADYVNGLLDSYNDFTDIEHLIAADISSDNLDGTGDEKTSDFLRALLAVRTLNNLGNSSKDPTTMSSVIQEKKKLIDKAAKLTEEGQNVFSNEEIESLLAQYYAQNKDLEQSDENSQKALSAIAHNAKKLQEAAQAFDKAEEQISKLEKQYGLEIDHQVKTKMALDHALGGHWKERAKKMKDEIGDSSSSKPSIDSSVMIAAVGGRKAANALVTTYNKQQAAMEKDLAEQKEKTTKLKEAYQKATDAVREAQEKNDSDAILETTKAEKEAKGAFEDAQQTEKYMEDMIQMTVSKREVLQGDIDTELPERDRMANSLAQEQLAKYQEELASLKKKYFKKDGTLKKRYAGKEAEINRQIEQYEKNISTRTETVSKYKERVLTADEIFALDPVTRARMMKKEMRKLYSEEQQKEIEKLENRLLLKDADALDKIQDIGLLTQRINSVEDAYTRMAKNPEAAAYAVERQRAAAAQSAAMLFNQRSAETIAETITAALNGLKGHSDISQETKDQLVYYALRKAHSRLLDIIDKDNLLPGYAQQVKNAKEWAGVTEDIEAVISSSDRTDEEKKNLKENIKRVLENTTTKEQIMTTLEKVIDDVENPDAVRDFETVLKGLERLGYQRNATILESRKERLEREAKEKEKQEAEKKRIEEETKAAAEKAVEKKEAEEEAKKKEEEASEKNYIDGSGKDVDLDLGEEEEKKEDKKEPSTAAPKATRIRKYTPIGGTEMEIPVEKDRVPLGELRPGDEFFGGNNEIYEVEKVLEDGMVLFHPRNNKDDHRGIDPKDFSRTQSTWGHEDGVDRIAKEQHEEKDNTKKEEGEENIKEEKKGENKEEEDNGSKKPVEGKPDEEENESNVIVDDDGVYVRSENIDEQLQENASENKDVDVVSFEEGEDADTSNAYGENNGDANPLYLSGTAMQEYVKKGGNGPLEKDGVIVRKKGSKPDDPMNRYFGWMKAAGIKLQNIIDHELGRILAANPHAKVKFMVVKPEHNATRDDVMNNHLMLVLDYDDSINKGITSFHDDKNGGVIESNGKKYLVIGTVGYGNSVEKRALRDIIYGNDPNSETGYGFVKRKCSHFFNDHPTERFYVDEEISTEVVPTYPIPGYRVRQMENDAEAKPRSMTELLADEERNPLHLTLEKMAWGIQELQQFAVVKADADKVMKPQDAMANLGRAFALIPASNGKLMPVYLQVLKYAEMNKGSLKEKIDALVQEVASPNYDKRKAAVIALAQILYFDKNGDYILLRKSRDEISFVHDGKVFKTFTLDSSFDRTEFTKAFEEMNPRINITLKGLKDVDTLKEYDEAGALMTDVAMLATAGSQFEIYALDGEGNMIKPNVQDNSSTGDNSPRSKDRSQIIFQRQYYREADGVFYLNGKPVTDEKTNRQLGILKRIIDNGLIPVESHGTLDYYILSSGEHPEAVKVDRNTKDVKIATEEQAKELIKRVEEKKDKEKREQMAKEILEKAKEEKQKSSGTKDAELDNGADFVTDPETGEIAPAPKSDTTNDDTDTGKKSDKADNNVDSTAPEEEGAPKYIPPTNSSLPKDSTQTFGTLIKERKYIAKVNVLMRKKWKDAPKTPAEMEKFLREKGVDVDNIGTSEKDIETWMKTIEDCRE